METTGLALGKAGIVVDMAEMVVGDNIGRAYVVALLFVVNGDVNELWAELSYVNSIRVEV